MNNHDFWKDKKVQKYDIGLFTTLQDNNVIDVLTNIGLPFIDQDYHRFYPINSLQYFQKQFIVLGTPFEQSTSFHDNLVLLDLSSQKIYYYNEAVFKIGLAPSITTIMNDSLESFLYYHQKMFEYINRFCNGSHAFQKAEVISVFKALVVDLLRKDSLGLGSIHNHQLFWRRSLSELKTDIEERYEEVIVISSLFS